MAELIPAPFRDLVLRLYSEPKVNDSLFALPRKKWWAPAEDALDLSVTFHGQRAGNASGPAAGPQTQMAQNILLSYAAGGRIMELKTVQVNDRLKIPRPCIDMTNLGYNVEWSQELLVEESLREYVAGMMLIEMFRRDPVFAGESLAGTAGQVIYDMSVGYDLAGIRSEKVQGFLDGMRDASAWIEKLRAEIPEEFKLARGLDYPKQISNTLTLSTFHGCPANEIEKICEFLIGERDLDVIVKMNPPMLGKERLEQLLHDVLGYRELTVNPTAYTSGLQFDESLQLTSRLTDFAKRRGRRFGAKFSNTLEVLNHRTFFTPENQVQYLSGQPLHVITMTLTDVYRQAVGPEVPISFSAGIDNKNFPAAVACGFVPVTTCSDLLKPGGYGRLVTYLENLTKEMAAVGAKHVDDFVLNAFGARENAWAGRACHDVAAAGLYNTRIVAEKARHDPRYRAEQNRKAPVRINSHLKIFDCITCDKCIPVCPNDANFNYPSTPVSFEYRDVVVETSGRVRGGDVKRFDIVKQMQIATYADFCNECGNCDTFCPEIGGPYIEKPGFYGTVESWKRAAPRKGFVVSAENGTERILGRLGEGEFELVFERAGGGYRFSDGVVSLNVSGAGDVTGARWAVATDVERLVDMGVYHTLRNLLHGVLNRGRVNQPNAGFVKN